MPNELSGAALDARFFEVCWGYVRREYFLSCWAWYRIDDTAMNESIHVGDDEVSTDANACEAWAMRWASEHGLRYEIAECADKVRVRLYDRQGRDFGWAEIWLAQEYGENFKEAFVRACVAAGTVLLTNGESKHGD